jgi:hypothetical protein
MFSTLLGSAVTVSQTYLTGGGNPVNKAQPG